MSLDLELKVTPQSGRQTFALDKSGMLKSYLKSKPEGGKANDELIKLLSQKLSIPQYKFRILQGLTARKKVIRIEADVTLQYVLNKLGIELQLTL